jgi:hypothetical protein
MTEIFPIVYAGNIQYFLLLKQAKQPVFDKHEHYIKQTYRSRCSIYGANGKLDLIIPVEKGKQGHQAMKDVKISYQQDWQRLHWKSLESAYRSSPYFEYYEHKFVPFYEEKTEYLADYNLKIHEVLCKLLEIDFNPAFTESYQTENIIDQRSFADPLIKINAEFKSYTQVFETRHGCIENLSVLDLLFNCGPEAGTFL